MYRFQVAECCTFQNNLHRLNSPCSLLLRGVLRSQPMISDELLTWQTSDSLLSSTSSLDKTSDSIFKFRESRFAGAEFHRPSSGWIKSDVISTDAPEIRYLLNWTNGTRHFWQMSTVSSAFVWHLLRLEAELIFNPYCYRPLNSVCPSWETRSCMCVAGINTRVLSSLVHSPAMVVHLVNVGCPRTWIIRTIYFATK